MAFCLCWPPADLCTDWTPQSVADACSRVDSGSFLEKDSSAQAGLATTHSLIVCGCFNSLAAFGSRPFPHCTPVLVDCRNPDNDLRMRLALDFGEPPHRTIRSLAFAE